MYMFMYDIVLIRSAQTCMHAHVNHMLSAFPNGIPYPMLPQVCVHVERRDDAL